MILTKSALRALTGYAQPKKMCAWLAARGWVFEPPARRGDIPKVDEAYYAARMAGKAHAPRREAPRLDFFKEQHAAQSAAQRVDRSSVRTVRSPHLLRGTQGA